MPSIVESPPKARAGKGVRGRLVQRAGGRRPIERIAELERARTDVLHRPGRERAGRHRPREQEALQLVAAERAQDLMLRLGLDALGDDLQADRVRQLDDAVDDFGTGYS